VDAGELEFQQEHRRQLVRLGDLLRQARMKAGLRQADMAKRLGRSQSYVTKYESGERRLDLFELYLMCEATGVPLEDLVRRFGARTV
jgi:transcriptional regulator with XRE-family HTH domain